MRLLTIEDDRSVRESIATYFEDSGFIVDQAENGPRGLDLLRHNQPDAVLVDLRMPGMNGFEVIQHVMEEFSGIPVIAVSATGVITDAIQAIRLGAWDFVTKPIQDMAILEHIVNKALDRARLIRQNTAYQEHLQEEVERQTFEIEHLYKTTPIGLALCDAEGRVVKINNKLAAISGQPTEAIVGKTIREALPLLADSFEAVHRRVLGSEQSELDVEIHETRDAEPDAARDWLISGHPVIYPGDGFRGVGFVLQDITDRKRQEQERLRLEQELRHVQKMEVVGTLAAGIAHDFNNLLAAIWGYIYLAQDNLPPDHPAYKYLEVVDGAIQDAAGIASSLLMLSRKTAVAMSQLNLGKIIKDSLKLLRHTMPASIEIEEHVDSPMPMWVCADVGLLHQVLMNVVANARDAMPDGGTLRISLTEEAGEGIADAALGPDDFPSSALVVIEDTGMGMSEEVISHIFEPFYTTKERGQGTGLGMAMVYGIVQMFKGRIDIESRPGCGTRISIRFPCSAPSEEREDSERGLATTCPGHGERILLAEDDQRVREFIVTALTEAGYVVTAVSRGDEAIDAFHCSPRVLDLAIFDLDLPGVSGLHCIEILLGERRGIPVIALTGSIDQRIPDYVPVQRVLHKPFRLSELTSLVKQTLSDAKLVTISREYSGSEVTSSA